MPLLGSKGNATAQGYGFGVPQGGPVGTIGIFALGCNGCGTFSTGRDKYTFACCSVTAGGSSTRRSQAGSAAGNSTRGIFALGQYQNSPGGAAICTNEREKYLYSTNTSALVGSGGFASSASQGQSATGNSTRGIFAIGNACGIGQTTTRNKYTYACDASGSATAASAASQYGSAAGNSTRGIFALGCASGPKTTRNKYTYSTDASCSATAASNASFAGAATGSSTIGIFALGYNACYARTTTRNKYTYACDTSGSATAASAASGYGTAAGNSTVGIFTLGTVVGVGASTTRNKYIYACNTSPTATASTVNTQRGYAASNGTTCVNV